MQSEQDQKIKQQIGYRWDNSLNFYLKTNIEGELISKIGNEFQILGPFMAHLHLNELSLICDMWLNKITYLLTYLLGKGYWIALYLFYKNEVYTERLVEFRIDGLDYYLEQVTKATRQKIMVIRIHKSSDRKWINTKYVKDFKLAK